MLPPTYKWAMLFTCRQWQLVFSINLIRWVICHGFEGGFKPCTVHASLTVQLDSSRQVMQLSHVDCACWLANRHWSSLRQILNEGV